MKVKGTIATTMRDDENNEVFSPEALRKAANDASGKLYDVFNEFNYRRKSGETKLVSFDEESEVLKCSIDLKDKYTANILTYEWNKGVSPFYAVPAFICNKSTWNLPSAPWRIIGKLLDFFFNIQIRKAKPIRIIEDIELQSIGITLHPLDKHITPLEPEEGENKDDKMGS